MGNKEYTNFKLNLNFVDVPKMASSSAKLTKFRIFSHVPINYLKEYLSLFNMALRDVPGFTPQTEESIRAMEFSRGVSGKVKYTLFLFNENSHLYGVSEILYDKNTPLYIKQGLTYISEDFRKRGWAFQMKCKMLLFIIKKFPLVQCLTTRIPLDNEPMYNLNRKVGFVLDM